MAISVIAGNRGTASEKVSDQDLTLVPTANLAAGSYGLLSVVIDNTGTAEGETNDLSVTDSQGHTWLKLREQTEANTTAETGVTGALFLARLTAGLTTSDTITITIAAAVTAKGAGLNELTCAAGFDIVLSAGGANGSNAVGATSYSVALSGLTNVPGLYVGLAAAEGEANADVTKDTAYTIAVSYGSGSVGIGPSNVIASTSTLANTSTGDTFDQTGLNAADRATILVRLEEQAQAAGGVTAAGAIASLEAFGVASLRQIVKPVGVVSAESVGAPYARLALRPLGIQSAEALGAPRLARRLSPNGIASAEAFGSTSRIVRLVQAGGIASAEAFGITTLAGIFVLLPTAHGGVLVSDYVIFEMFVGDEERYPVGVADGKIFPGPLIADRLGG